MPCFHQRPLSAAAPVFSNLAHDQGSEIPIRFCARAVKVYEGGRINVRQNAGFLNQNTVFFHKTGLGMGHADSKTFAIGDYFNRCSSAKMKFVPQFFGNDNTSGCINASVRKNCRNGNCRESWTAYKSWGKGKKVELRFSKSGEKAIERTYATHFFKPVDEQVRDACEALDLDPLHLANKGKRLASGCGSRG